MDLHGVYVYEIKDKVFEYLPLLSEEAVKTGLKTLPCLLLIINRTVYQRFIEKVVRRSYWVLPS
jgi:hypothetical protein